MTTNDNELIQAVSSFFGVSSDPEPIKAAHNKEPVLCECGCNEIIPGLRILTYMDKRNYYNNPSKFFINNYSRPTFELRIIKTEHISPDEHLVLERNDSWSVVRVITPNMKEIIDDDGLFCECGSGRCEGERRRMPMPRETYIKHVIKHLGQRPRRHAVIEGHLPEELNTEIIEKGEGWWVLQEEE